jgi:hypothetical protein
MQFSPRPGDTVTARGARWVVVDVRAYDSCRVVTLSGAAPPGAGNERRLIHPFDAITLESTVRPRHGSSKARDGERHVTRPSRPTRRRAHCSMHERPASS